MFSDDCISKMKHKYILYGNKQLARITNKDGVAGNDVRIKLEHGLAMSDAVKATSFNSGLLNDSYTSSAAVDGLLHDIGRFEQYLLTSTLEDSILKSNYGFDDHGQYGRYILSRGNKSLLRHFLGDITSYDDILLNIIANHTKTFNKNYIIPLEKIGNVFNNYDIKEIIKGNDKQLVNYLIALKLMILKEEDSLEILHKVRDGIFRPVVSCNEKNYIKDICWQKFINFEYFDIPKLKEQLLWTCNTGFLLRYGLLFSNVNLVGTLKTIMDDELIEKIFIQQKANISDVPSNLILNEKIMDPKMLEAKKFTLLVVKNLIETSPDGIFITTESRKKAKEKTLIEYQ